MNNCQHFVKHSLPLANKSGSSSYRQLLQQFGCFHSIATKNRTSRRAYLNNVSPQKGHFLKSNDYVMQKHVIFCPKVQAWRQFTSSSSGDGSKHHEFFQEQMLELQRERETMFGTNDDKMDSMDNIMQQEQQQQQEVSFREIELEDEYNEMEDLHAEREALFQFSSTERQAWSTVAKGTTRGSLSRELLAEIAQARAAVDGSMGSSQGTSSTTHEDASLSNPSNSPHESFTHVSSDSQSIHMVDVGDKKVTTRTAHAQAKVILPASVLEAMQSDQSQELVGPKGPIFATAKVAGIMAAKKTSELIPLCHPLPLDQVTIDIVLQGHDVIVDCHCRVTHKTGVEMEALTGASVAALTIYDMVKAVSHQVEITDVRLVAKAGGKRLVSNPQTR